MSNFFNKVGWGNPIFLTGWLCLLVSNFIFPPRDHWWFYLIDITGILYNGYNIYEKIRK